LQPTPKFIPGSASVHHSLTLATRHRTGKLLGLELEQQRRTEAVSQRLRILRAWAHEHNVI